MNNDLESLNAAIQNLSKTLEQLKNQMNPITPNNLNSLDSSYRNKPGVYALYCKKNKRTYIGKGSCLYQRIASHLSNLRNNKHINADLQADFNKFEEREFSIFILYEGKDIEKMEKLFINLGRTFDSKYGYNVYSANPNLQIPNMVFRLEPIIKQ